ncbi:hypothetical protein ACIBQ1_31845 [Nonomuraea sp. NPDC050153]|uniref:hypothetical protein n=1 Tax=Nonomuraea sp. NPDC050153 TaxID=3364359 RepID=UPI0037BD844F
MADDLDAMCRLYLEPVAYEAQFGWVTVLPSMPAAYARPGGGGRGIGAALAVHAHAEAAAGVETAAPNPRSVPFWARQGYRPLVTTWGRWVQRPG